MAEKITDWSKASVSHDWSWWQLMSRIALLALAYFLLGQLSFSLAVSKDIVTPVIFMAEGVSLAAVILWGPRLWPGVFIGQCALGIFNGLPFLPTVCIAAVNSFEAVLGAWLFARLGIHPRYDRVQDVGRLTLLIIFVLQPISSIFGTLILAQTGTVASEYLWGVWEAWWLGNLIGQIVCTPMLLILHARLRKVMPSFGQIWPPTLAILLICAFMFFAPRFQDVNLAVFLVMPMMVLFAARYGMLAATLGTFAIVALNLYLVAQGFKLFAAGHGDRYVDLDLFLLSLALVGQFVAALLAERQQAEQGLLEHRERLNEAQRIASVGSWTLDLKTKVLDWSDEIYRIFEVDPQKFDASYAAFLAAIHPEDREKVNQAYSDSVHNHEPYTLMHRLLFADGRIKYVEERCETVYDEDGKPLLSHGTVLDVTAIKQAEEMLHIYANVFSHSRDAIVITDVNNNIIEVNPAFTALTGYSCQEVRGKNPRVLSSGKNPPEIYVELWRSLLEYGVWQGELWDRRKDGSLYLKAVTISTMQDAAGKIVNHMARFFDITERRANEERIRRLAHHDPLTGLANRFSLESRLEQALLNAQREKAHLAVIFLDMDRFKSINDTYGHHIGDLLLIEVANRLQTHVRASDIVARLGGDEFVVILTGDVSQASAAQIAAKLVEQLAQPYALDGLLLHSSPSLGVSLYPEQGEDARVLMMHADVAMYHAKKEGRNRYKLFTAAMTATIDERQSLENDLRQALELKQLELHYQPQVCAENNQLFRVEALARWRHPSQGFISPAQFIPLVDKAGLTESFGAWVIDEACRQLAFWQANGVQDVRMAVNISATQLRSPNFIEIVREAKQRHGIAQDQLTLELSEAVTIDNPEHALHQLNSLRAVGVELAIGDFGAGFASLSHLRVLPIQTLKLSRSFISSIENDANASIIIVMILELARKLGIKVVGEGVETEQQRAFLVQHNCDLLQGYLVSQPLSGAEATKFISAQVAKSTTLH